MGDRQPEDGQPKGPRQRRPHAYDPDVADQRLREARAAYIEAVRRLDAALQAFDGSGMPMDPGPDPDRPYPWTQRHIRIVTEAAEAFTELVATRREWDALPRRQAAGE
jgi:hypothetical protein